MLLVCCASTYSTVCVYISTHEVYERLRATSVQQIVMGAKPGAQKPKTTPRRLKIAFDVGPCSIDMSVFLYVSYCFEHVYPVSFCVHKMTLNVSSG